MFLRTMLKHKSNVLKCALWAVFLSSLSSIAGAQTMYLSEKSPIIISNSSSDGNTIPIKCNDIQQGTLIKELIQTQFPDGSGSNKRHVGVYLPPNFSSTNNYPVVLFLDAHPSKGKVNAIPEINKALACGLIEPSIFVFPETYRGVDNTGSLVYNSKFIEADDNSNVDSQWEEVMILNTSTRNFIELELLPYLQSEYGADLSKKYVLGYASGASNALKLAITSPSDDFPSALQFKGVGILSPCLQTQEYFDTYAPGVVLDEDPILDQLKNRNADFLIGTNWYVAIGEFDEGIDVPICDSLKGAKTIYETLYAKHLQRNAIKTNHISIKIQDGKHNKEFWENHLIDLFAFLFGRKICYANDATCSTGVPK